MVVGVLFVWLYTLRELINAEESRQIPKGFEGEKDLRGIFLGGLSVKLYIYILATGP